ncbi:toxin-antitoxin system HicB family antitoxin [Chloroflexota bacterium]
MEIKGGTKPLEYYLGLNYPVTLYHAEEGGFAAEIEDLPGCLTQGETVEEAMENIEEARQLWVKAAYEDGVEIPIPRTDEEYSGRFLVRIPKSLHRRLAEQARYQGVSLNQYVESILSAGASTQSVVGEIKTELDKISRQIAVQRTPLVEYARGHSDLIWVRGGTEQEPEIPAQSVVETMEEELVAA